MGVTAPLLEPLIFPPPVFSLLNVSVSTISSGSNRSVNVGVFQPFLRHAEYIAGMPLPEPLPIPSLKKSALVASFLGSETPPLFAASGSVRNLPPFLKVMLSPLFIISTPPPSA